MKILGLVALASVMDGAAAHAVSGPVRPVFALPMPAWFAEAALAFPNRAEMGVFRGESMAQQPAALRSHPTQLHQLGRLTR